MVRVLIAGLVAMVIAVAVGPQFIEWLRRQSIGQQIREEGPASHRVKQGTPTMGGLLIVVAAFVPALIVGAAALEEVVVVALVQPQEQEQQQAGAEGDRQQFHDLGRQQRRARGGGIGHGRILAQAGTAPGAPLGR